MRRALPLLSALAGLLLPLAAAADANRSPWSGSEITLDKRGSLVIALFVANKGGATAVCGLVWPGAEATSGTMTQLDPVLRNLILTVGGRPLNFNGGAFPVLKSEAEAERAEPGCSVTTRPWEARFAAEPPDLRMRGKTYRE